MKFMARIVASLNSLALFALIGLTSACQPTPAIQQRETRPLMGTVVDLTLEGRDPARLKQALDDAYREMTRLSDMMNHYNPNSVVSAINNAAGKQPVAVPPELMLVLKMARQVSDRSHGAFDITVGSLKGWRFNPADPAMPSQAEIAAQLPKINYRDVILDEAAGTVFLRQPGMRMDLGGIAKLYILDTGMKILKKHGIEHAMLNGGGDVVVNGTTQGRPWRVGIRDPHAPEKLLAAIEITHGIVASSGDYARYFLKNGQRYHHILDPRTGYPTQGLHGVTLVADTLEQVNGLGAAIMVLGAAPGKELINQTPGLSGLLVDREDKLWVSPGLEKRLRFFEQAGDSVPKPRNN
jgi:thiamine biosynthesis lipoprotein